jgi:hypothetical protein
MRAYEDFLSWEPAPGVDHEVAHAPVTVVKKAVFYFAEGSVESLDGIAKCVMDTS